MSKLPVSVDVVIIGGGIAGSSIAYHLALLGRKCVVLEQNALVSGTTSHAPGLVGQLRSSPVLMKILMESVALYKKLPPVCYQPVGSIRLASSTSRLQELNKQLSKAKSVGLEARLLTTSEIKAMAPPTMSMAGVQGGLYVPSDGSASPVEIAKALIVEGKKLGVQFFEHCAVTSILRSADQKSVAGVQTSLGTISTSTLVVAAGVWTPGICRKVGVPIALVPIRHQYVETKPIEGLNKQYPNIRDPDHLIYWRQGNQNGNTTVLYGGYERTPQTLTEELRSSGSETTVYNFDDKNFTTIVAGTVSRWPILDGKIARKVCGIESFTADGEFIVGPTKRLGGLWIACGFCAHGISGSGGIGKYLAQWIHTGRTDLDFSSMSVDRFDDKAFDFNFVATKATGIYSTYYDITPQTSAKL